MTTLHDGMAPAPEEPGRALAEWLMSAPSTGHERAARADLAAFMRESRLMRESWIDLRTALHDYVLQLEAHKEAAVEGYHSDRWLDGYRAGYAHAEGRAVMVLMTIVRAMEIVEGGEHGQQR